MSDLDRPPRQEDFDHWKGMVGKPLTAENPLEKDTLRRFVQAIMDSNKRYVDETLASNSRYKGLVAPPLYPVHAFRPSTSAPDPLALIQEDPNADGAGQNDGVFFGLPPITSPFKRLLNGGNEIEFFRCLAVGEHCVAKATYKDVVFKEGKSGFLLFVVIETAFSTESGAPLLINRQTLIWR
jgi:hypothetical protein